MQKARTKQKFVQGIYYPRRPEKYKGDVKNIIYRSSWELQFMTFCDNSPSIIEWASEEIAIPYVKPTDKRVHYYYLDFWIKYISDEPERGLPYWKKINYNSLSDMEKSQIDLIFENKADFSNVHRGTTTPDSNMGEINDIYVIQSTKEAFIKVNGGVLLDSNNMPIKKVKKMIVEIKPENQLNPPKPQKRVTTAYKNKCMAWIINDAKWKYAEAFAEKNGMEFKIITEKFLKNHA